jgi:serine/threonine protein kinase
MLIEQIGAGGFGEVWGAIDQRLGRKKVAIKRLSLTGLISSERQDQIKSFQEEAILLAHLRDDRLPQVTDYFAEGQDWFLVMDYIMGKTLANLLEDLINRQHGEFSVDETIQIGIQLCSILEYLHNQQPPIIFRDLKPANIIKRASDGKICLIDFGIARKFKSGQAKDTAAYGSSGYAAPEQYGRTQTDPRADIYSLGVTLFELVTMHDPRQSPFTIPVRLIPDTRLRHLITRMVENDREKRPASVNEVSQALQQLLRPSSPAPAQPKAISGVSISAFQAVPPSAFTPDALILPDPGTSVYPTTQSKDIFMLYPQKNEKVANIIEKDLAPFKRQLGLQVYHNSKDVHSGEIKKEVAEQVQASCMVVVILSSWFWSDYAYDLWVETVMPAALSTKISIFPVLVEPVDLDNFTFPGVPELAAQRALPDHYRDERGRVSIKEMQEDEAYILINRTLKLAFRLMRN